MCMCLNMKSKFEFSFLMFNPSATFRVHNSDVD